MHDNQLRAHDISVRQSTRKISCYKLHRCNCVERDEQTIPNPNPHIEGEKKKVMRPCRFGILITYLQNWQQARRRSDKEHGTWEMRYQMLLGCMRSLGSHNFDDLGCGKARGLTIECQCRHVPCHRISNKCLMLNLPLYLESYSALTFVDNWAAKAKFIL